MCEKGAMAEASSSRVPKEERPEMKSASMLIGTGAQLCTHLTHEAGYLAVALEGTPTPTTVDTWYVGVFYMGPCWETHSQMHRVAYQRSPGLDPHASPTGLSISPDGVLAVSLGTGGVRLFSLAIPIGPRPMVIQETEKLLLPGGVTHLAKWIKEATKLRALVTCASYPNKEVLSVHGRLTSCDRRVSQELLQTPAGGITHVAAAVPGHIAVHETVGQVLHILKLQDDDSEFQHKKIALMSLEADRAKAASAQCAGKWKGHTITVSMAIGDDLVVVGLSPSLVGGAPGVVEAFCLETGTMLARRLTPWSVPTALSTSGSRVLIATSLPAASFGVRLGELPASETEHASGIYAMTVHGPHNFTVAKGGPHHAFWPQGTLHLDERTWCYARTVMGEGGTVTVVEHAAVPTRPR